VSLTYVAFPYNLHYTIPGMLTRPAGHEAEAEKFFEAEATMYEAEAEATHV